MSKATSSILIVLAIALFYTFTRPQYQAVKGLEATAGQYRNVLQNISEIEKTRDALLVDYEKIPKAEIDRLSKVLPEDADSVRLALDLDGIAARYGISIKDIQVDIEPRESSGQIVLPQYGVGYERAYVSFSFVSNYPNFKGFLEDLEKNLRIMNMSSISFRVEESGFYEHDITLETYWLKQN